MDLPLPALAPAMERTEPRVTADADDRPAPPPARMLVAATSAEFEGFYRDARESVGRAVALALGDVDLAVEATDEALTRAYERWATVSALDRPEGWVYRVAVNWALSVLRRRRRTDPRLYAQNLTDAAAVPDPAVHAALAELDVKHRSVIVCRHLLGWSVAETAAALHMREGTVKSRLHRAGRVLRTRLDHLRTTEENS